MYEAQLTQKSLSNQAAFCWSMWRIHVTESDIPSCKNSFLGDGTTVMTVIS